VCERRDEGGVVVHGEDSDTECTAGGTPDRSGAGYVGRCSEEPCWLD
jgi:hypothetical protein